MDKERKCKFCNNPPFYQDPLGKNLVCENHKDSLKESMDRYVYRYVESIHQAIDGDTRVRITPEIKELQNVFGVSLSRR